MSVGEVYATGSGQSKKKAKHEAAKAILTKLKIAQKKGPFDSHASQAQTCHFCHNRLVWSKFRENGGGKSKKLAKRKAAARMLATLKSQPVLVDDNDGGGAAKKKRQKKKNFAGRYTLRLQKRKVARKKICLHRLLCLCG